MTNEKLTQEKKAVLIRIPQPMYEDLLNLSAAATLLQRRSISVPAIILKLLEETTAGKSGGIVRAQKK
jgi:hypothetical protein